MSEVVHPVTGEVIQVTESFAPKPTTARHIDGREYLDPTQIAPPIGYTRQKSLAEQIREMVRSENLRHLAEQAGHESFEEADDFEMEDFDPTSPYEEVFDSANPAPIPTPLEAAITAAGVSEGARGPAKRPAPERPQPLPAASGEE